MRAMKRTFRNRGRYAWWVWRRIANRLKRLAAAEEE